MATKHYLGAALILVILSSSVYFLMPDKVRVDVEKTRTKYSVMEEGKFVLGATEYVNLYDGSTMMRALSRELKIWNDSDYAYASRISKWKDNLTTIHDYILNIDNVNVEDFPFENKLLCINCQGKIVQYEIRDILYEGETDYIKSPFSFGHNMKIEWDDRAYYSKVFQQKYASDKIIIKFKPDKDYETFSVRLFDPEIKNLTLSSLDTQQLIDVGLDKTQGIEMDLIYNGLTNKILEIKIDKEISAQDMGIYLTNSNFNATKLEGKLTKKNEELIDKPVWVRLCNPYNETVVNESGSNLMHHQNCTTYQDGTEEFNFVSWEEISLKSKDENSNEKIESYPILTKGVYRYNFKVPLLRTNKGWGSTGELQVIIDDIAFVDRQGSSWWNETWTNRKAITVKSNRSFSNEPILIDVTGLTLATDNCTAELVITDNGSNQLLRAILDDAQQADGDGSEACLIQFSMNKNASVNQTYYVYYNNPTADEIAGQEPNIWGNTNDQMYQSNWVDLIQTPAKILYSPSLINIGPAGAAWLTEDRAANTSVRDSKGTFEIRLRFNQGAGGAMYGNGLTGGGYYCLNTTGIGGDGSAAANNCAAGSPNEFLPITWGTTDFHTIRFFSINTSATADTADNEEIDIWLEPYNPNSVSNLTGTSFFSGRAGYVGLRDAVSGTFNITVDYVYISDGWQYPPEMITLGAEETPSSFNLSIIQNIETIFWDTDEVDYALNVTVFNLASSLTDSLTLRVDKRFNSTTTSVGIIPANSFKTFRYTNTTASRSTSDVDFNITSANITDGIDYLYSNTLGMFIPGQVGGVAAGGGDPLCTQYLQVDSFTGLTINYNMTIQCVNSKTDVNYTNVTVTPNVTFGSAVELFVAANSTNQTSFYNVSARGTSDGDFYNISGAVITGNISLITNEIKTFIPIDPPYAFTKDGIVDCDQGMRTLEDITLAVPLVFRGAGKFIIGAVLRVTGFGKDGTDCEVSISTGGQLEVV